MTHRDSTIPLYFAGPPPELETHLEPVTVGIPVAAGLVTDLRRVGVEAPNGTALPVQASITDRWPDGSARWVLLDMQIDRVTGQSLAARFTTAAQSAPDVDDPLTVTRDGDGIQVRTGPLAFTFRHGAAFPVSNVTRDGVPLIDPQSPGLTVAAGDVRTRYVIDDVRIRREGPLRTELWVRARVAVPTRTATINAWARVEVFAGQPIVRLEITLHNPRRASHPGGQWSLGDPGSVLIDEASVAYTIAPGITGATCATEPGAPHRPCALPIRIHQESSGGEHWDAPVHRARDGRVPLRYRGYECQTGGSVTRGDRALPVVVLTTPAGRLSVTMPQFWQQFPRAIEVTPRGLILDLAPALTGTPHELQGGEQKTHTVVVSVGDDRITSTPLAWCHDPAVIHADPASSCAHGGIPGLLPASEDPSAAYLHLVGLALDDEHGFVAKRERADEYGWRNFGDLPADHESAFQPSDQPFVSHYNNQYDAVAGFAMHFLRTGDRRWWPLMADLTAHVRDIDIYRTRDDKAVYNGGLFWHTNHYVDAGLSTHRTYPPGGTDGGGPSAEHNYNYGLMLHYFLTGDERSRDAAIDLGQWVIDMDDGRLTPLRWLSRNPTGWASYTAGHHHPGRGAGHSILACLVAHRLSSDRRFLDKAEELIRRCVAPDGPVPAAFVEDVEGFWSYTAFLQALGFYLDHKLAAGERDAMAGWARAALLRFARFMADHERPYLDRREKLQFPTQTWAAQDLRKADVFLWAALHTEGEERARFLDRADFFFGYATTELPRLDGHWFTRPIVLVLTQGIRYGWFARHRDRLPPPVPLPPPPGVSQRRFVAQRQAAVRRAVTVAGATALAAALTAWWLVS